MPTNASTMTVSADQQRQATRILASAVRPRMVRAFWGEAVPTLVLVAFTWSLTAGQLFPRMVTESIWWWIPWIGGCLLLATWLVRVFVIMHDAGHGAFAPRGWVNQVIGQLCGVLVFTPMIHWSKLHWHHHQSSGNLDKQDGLGDIYTMSVSRYLSLPRWQQVLYRGFRHRLHFFLVIPSVMFFFFHRLPFVYFPWAGIVRRPKPVELVNIAALDIIYILVGWWTWSHWDVARPWAITYAVSILMTVTVGVVLFYTQHQFENSYYAHDDEWSFFESGIRGSMTLRLPYRWMEWVIGYINFHAVHHLKPTIPLYNLPETHEALKHLGIPISESRVSDLARSYRCHLWDEHRKRMISFADVEPSR